MYHKLRVDAKIISAFNPSRTSVRNISPFRGAPPDPLARTFSPRRDPSDPDQPVGNGNASVPGYQPPQS